MKKFFGSKNKAPPGPRPEIDAGPSPTSPVQPGGFGSNYSAYPAPEGPPPTAPPGTFAPPPGPPPGELAGGHAPPPGPPPAGHGREDPFSQLGRYDTVFLVDDSGSMEMFWDETRDALIGVVEKTIVYDDDGIDLYFFNSPHVAQSVRSPQDVKRTFDAVFPSKSTPTATALRRVLDPYITALESAKAAGPSAPKLKPLNVVCLTDGAPDRGEDPEGVIVEAGRRLDAGRFPLFQVGIQFIQIGADDEATVHLQKLDDDLKAKHKIRDMVDTTPYQVGSEGSVTGQYLLKSLLGGLNRKIDREG